MTDCNGVVRLEWPGLRLVWEMIGHEEEVFGRAERGA